MSRKTNTAKTPKTAKTRKRRLAFSRSFAFSRYGFTLTEVLVALVLGGILIIALSNVDITRTKLSQSTDSLINVQREATEALQHIQKRVVGAYYLYFSGGGGSPPELYVQVIDPGKVSVPPDPALITERTAANWANFVYHGYRLEAGQLVYYENVKPCTTDAARADQTKRRTILVKNVTSWSASSNDTVPADRFYHTGILFGLGVTDPATSKVFTIGPTELVSRSLGGARPAAWRPPTPPGTPAPCI